jgi:23S rRNA pseudouridine2605 synthase
MRLNAFLARAGIASRRGADELIRAGRVRVNDAPAELATYVGEADRVEVDGEPVGPEPLAYVLLHTNDGPLAHRLSHPRYGVDKVYEVVVEGDPRPETLERLRTGVELEDGRTAPAGARRLGRCRLEVTIHEGRKHQVKRMLAAVGHPVRRLHRRAYAGLTVDGLAQGEWRALGPEEVESLRAAIRAPTSPRGRRGSS